MATETVRAKVRLAGRLDVLAQPGRSLLPGELQQFAPNEDPSALDASQRVAACAIAGTDGLVTVTGPAGAGKTTMLRAAFAALTSQRRRMLVVSPTRRAASVASREVGAARRNDRLTGVENRAQWIVRGIRDEYLSLVSVSDSGEVTRVSTEYARGHLQLAYASTVHGVQGDTADASVAGPDVDAAGLYVGLTRGRLSNVAVVVARTDSAARECLAESMQRGTPELTIQDAVRAARAELRRAARNREAAMVTGPIVGAPSAARGLGM